MDSGTSFMVGNGEPPIPGDFWIWWLLLLLL